MTEIQPAARELAALAYAMRGWDPEHTMSAMIAAKNAGWDFERTAREVFRLLMLEDGEPAALRHAAGSLLRPVDSKPADDGHRGELLSPVRAHLDAINAAKRAARDNPPGDAA